MAIAIVDSVIRMIAPPKTAATISAARAETTIAGTSPRFAFPSTDGRSGS